MFLRIPLLAVLAALLAAAPAAAQSTTIVISEYRTRGPNGGNDEFIELRNKAAAPVDLGSHRVNGSNASGTVSTRATIPAGVTLQPGCAYLLSHSAGTTAGDQTYGTGITDDGGIAVLTRAWRSSTPSASRPARLTRRGRRSRRRPRTPTSPTSATGRPATPTTTPPTSRCARPRNPSPAATARRRPATRRRRSARRTPPTAPQRSTRTRTPA